MMDVSTLFKQVGQDCVLLWEKRSLLWNQRTSWKDEKTANAARRVFLALALTVACSTTLILIYRKITFFNCLIMPAISILIYGIMHDICVMIKNDSQPVHKKMVAVGIEAGKDIIDKGRSVLNYLWHEKEIAQKSPRHHLTRGTFFPLIWNSLLQSHPNYFKNLFNTLNNISGN